LKEKKIEKNPKTSKGEKKKIKSKASKPNKTKRSINTEIKIVEEIGENMRAN
jgi:hypothetical protein